MNVINNIIALHNFLIPVHQLNRQFLKLIAKFVDTIIRID